MISSRRSRRVKMSSTTVIAVVVSMVLMMMMMLQRNRDPMDRAGHPPAENIRDSEVRFHLHHGEQAVLDSAWMIGHRSTVILARSVRQEASLSVEDVVVATAKVTG